MRRPMPSPGRTVVHRPAPHWRSVTGSQARSHAVAGAALRRAEKQATVDMPGALLHGFRHRARQATVTGCGAQSVISRLLCAHIPSMSSRGWVRSHAKDGKRSNLGAASPTVRAHLCVSHDQALLNSKRRWASRSRGVKLSQASASGTIFGSSTG